MEVRAGTTEKGNGDRPRRVGARALQTFRKKTLVDRRLARFSPVSFSFSSIRIFVSSRFLFRTFFPVLLCPTIPARIEISRLNRISRSFSPDSARARATKRSQLRVSRIHRNHTTNAGNRWRLIYLLLFFLSFFLLTHTSTFSSCFLLPLPPRSIFLLSLQKRRKNN